MSESNNDNLLGSVIYEPNNPKQQALLVQDLSTSVQKEYPMDQYANINIDGKRHSLSNILTGNRGNELRSGIKDNENISFILSKSELGNFQKLDKSFRIERPEVNTSELDKLKNEIKALESKMGTVEKFFQNNQGSFKEFNKYLVDEKENKADLSNQNEPKNEVAATKKADRGMDL